MSDHESTFHDHDPDRVFEVERKPAPLDQSNEIVNILTTYHQEAEQNRMSGLNPRDMKWKENLDLYWNRFDFSAKASWQSQEVMPEVPGFVDRFAASLKSALVALPTGFYTVNDPGDTEGDLEKPIKALTDAWLSICGRNQTGSYLDFSTVFEEQVKMGALMACNSVVLWKGDRKHGRVSVETIDPRFTWLDHTYRNLYRIRRTEIDKHELKALARLRDGSGKPIYNLDNIEQMTGLMMAEDSRRREELTGSGEQIIAKREVVTLDEYIATVVGSDGKVLADKALMVVANGQHLIRGPEKNPFWHGKDWMVHAPLINTPLSVYGRTYMEDFGAVAKTFNELTNLILDAVRMSSLKAFAVVPDMLLNPAQLNEGMTPMKLFMLEEGFRAEDFAKVIDLGNLPPEAFQVWQAMKSELREAAAVNEIGLGQFAPKGRTSATEVSSTQESSSELIRSIAQTVEGRYLNPTLDLVWKTGLQHMNPNDQMLRNAAGPEMFDALYASRKELIKRPITFQAQGISSLMQKSKTLRSLLQLMAVIAQSEPLTQAFLQRVDLNKLTNLLFELSDVDIRKLEPTQRERQVQQLQQQFAQAQQNTANAEPNGAHTEAADQAASALGVGRAG